jgi:hypothetical protein
MNRDFFDATPEEQELMKIESAQYVTSAASLLDQNSRVRYRLHDTLPVTFVPNEIC